MQELSVQTTAPALTANFDAINAELDRYLADYDALVVTPENVKDARAAATEINQRAGEIDQRRKDAIAVVSQPIKAFDEQAKGLVSKCKDTRRGILDQVAVFDDKVRQQADDLLAEKRAALWDEANVGDEFRKAEIKDLAKTSAVTEKGNLTKAAREAIEARVRDDRALQDKVERRLLELERDCYKAGLGAPLTREHVAGFLQADDETYAAKLEALIAAEVEREQQAEQRRQVAAAKREAAQPAPAPAAPPPPPQPEPVEAPAGRDVWNVTAVFRLSVKAGVSKEQITAKVRERLTAAGIDDPTHLEAVCNAPSG